MEWTIEPTGRYTLASGTCVAAVWPSGNQRYGGMVTYKGLVRAQYGFARLEDAQGWCLTQLAELRMSGKCGSTAVASDTDKAG